VNKCHLLIDAFKAPLLLFQLKYQAHMLPVNLTISHDFSESIVSKAKIILAQMLLSTRLFSFRFACPAPENLLDALKNLLRPQDLQACQSNVCEQQEVVTCR